MINHQGNLYGINDEALFQYSIETGKSLEIKSKRGGFMTEVVLLENKVHVAYSVSGLLYAEGEALHPTFKKSLENISVSSISQYEDEPLYLLEKEDETLWRIEKETLKKVPLKPEDAGYLTRSRIQQIEWIKPELVALSTLTGGIVFLNPLTGKLKQILDTDSGLPDDEVYLISTDREKSLWISHRKGFARVSPSIPFRNFNGYDGLEGELLSTVVHQCQLYVGTTTGLYLLKEDKQYINELYKETREILEEGAEKIAEEKVPDPEPKKRRKGLFSFLKRKEKTQKLTSDSANNQPTYVKKVITEQRVRKKLHSIQYRYERVAEITARVTELVSYQNQLLVGSLSGFFEVIDNKATQIANEPVRSLYFSSHYSKAFLSTANNEIKVFDMGGLPRELYLFGDLSSYTTHIFEDETHRIWFCGTNKMIWITLSNSDLDDTGEVSFDNPYFYETYGAASDDKILFINAGGKYQLQEDKIVKISESVKYVKGAGNDIWLLEPEGWSRLSVADSGDKFSMLSVFENPTYLSLEKENVWLINNQTLLKAKSESGSPISSTYNLLLRSMVTDSSNVNASGKLILDQDKSALKFEFIKPDYSGIIDIQYQYQLSGLASSDWTDWSTDYSTIAFPYLPEGDYELKVRARDSFGVISDAQVIDFKVVPPYWKRPWFYALEFTALGLLLVMSLRIKRLGDRYLWISRLLALMTLIIIIEFIQTIAENEFQTKSSAIFDFTVQVLVAITVLPLEGFLRKYIFKDKNVKLKDIFRNKEINESK